MFLFDPATEFYTPTVYCLQICLTAVCV